jgi:peptidoglycan-N-acetylglucosamine deacetylase
LAFAAIVAAVILLPGPWSWWVAACVLAAFLAVVGRGVFAVNSGLWARTLWRAPEAVNAVALTFDDGPDPAFTPKVLDLLKTRGARAAFFCVGERVRAHPELARRIHEEGHLLGNHSDSHAMWINFGGRRRLRAELNACNAAIAAAAGVTPALYRAPHGFKNPALGDVLRELGMTAVGWQARALDAVRQDADAIVRRLVDGAAPGGVLTLHDGSGLQGSRERKATLAALPVILDGLHARGLKVVRLDELLNMPAYRAADGGTSAAARAS